MILKFRKNISEWYSLYANAIKNRLRRDLNLGDVCDVQETRDNIGLSGDNNHTHYHDDRYIPIIEKRINELDNKLNNIIPIGTIMTWPSNVPPDTYRWLECNGQSFDTTDFPDLYKVFPNGRVPDLREKFLEGYSKAGNDISPGLPGWWQQVGNFLTWGATPGVGNNIAFNGGGAILQASDYPYIEMIKNIIIGGFGNFSTSGNTTVQSDNVTITCNGTYTDGDGNSHGVTVTGNLPVWIEKMRCGSFQTITGPSTFMADKYFGWYTDGGACGIPSGYARGHELYGKSSTVQPRAYTVKFYVRAK